MPIKKEDLKYEDDISCKDDTLFCMDMLPLYDFFFMYEWFSCINILFRRAATIIRIVDQQATQALKSSFQRAPAKIATSLQYCQGPLACMLD